MCRGDINCSGGVVCVWGGGAQQSLSGQDVGPNEFMAAPN